MHPGEEAGAFHPKHGDKDVGDEDEEDNDGCVVVQAVQALLVGLYSDVSSCCSTGRENRDKMHKNTCRLIHLYSHHRMSDPKKKQQG